MMPNIRPTSLAPARYCALAAITMAYGWGYRGTVGHEQGAMVPGALLGLVLCLGSGRLDWHRRAAVAGLFAAVGWAWGGSISYMEQTFYVLSDSFVDVLYGYSALFFIGGLWAGCGGAILGLALTESRSALGCLTRPFIALGTAYLLGYLYLTAMPEHNEAYETFTVVHFHDGDWLSATIALVVGAVYWIVRPKDRSGAALIFSAAVAWWIGYGLLTKLGGLRLAPLHRSESWGGVLGVLVVLIIYLIRRQNRAALLLCLYGCVGGGLAFALAVFVHNPLAMRLGPLADLSVSIPAWRIGETCFGLFMGLALALGALRLLRGGISPPEEDENQTPLDTFAVFVVTVGLGWMNFRRHIERVLAHSPDHDKTLLGLPTGSWYFLVAVLVSIAAIYVLYCYRCGDRALTPQSVFGKGVVVTLLLLWSTVGMQLLDAYPTRDSLIANLSLWLPAAIATCLLVSFSPQAEHLSTDRQATVLPSDARWRVGGRYILVCAGVPFVLLGITGLSTAMQDGPFGARARYRFGQDAYWRQTERLQGIWDVVGRANELGSTSWNTEALPLVGLEFDEHRNATAVLPSGERVDAHRWFLKNQYIWLQWFSKLPDHDLRGEVPLQFRGDRIYVAWPLHQPSGEYLVLQRIP